MPQLQLIFTLLPPPPFLLFSPRSVCSNAPLTIEIGQRNKHLYVEDRVVDTYRRSRTLMGGRTRHRSGSTRSRVANGVNRHRRR